MFKWYKSGIFEKVIPQIRSSGIDLRLSGIVGIDTNINLKIQSYQAISRNQLLFFWCFISHKTTQNAVITYSPFY